MDASIPSIDVFTALLSIMLIIVGDALLLVKVMRRKMNESGSVEVQCTYDQTCGELSFAI